MNSFVHKLLEYSAHFSSRQIPSSGRVGLLGQIIIAFVILVYFAQLPTVVKNGISVLYLPFSVSEVEHLFVCLRSFCVSFLFMPVSLEPFSFVGLSLICRGPYITKISPLYVL